MGDGPLVFWHWLAASAVLMIAEMLIPGYFMFWLGLAAGALGLLLLAWPLGSIEAQLGLFAVLAVVCVYAGRRFFKRNDPPPLAGLNQPQDRWLGWKTVLTEPVSEAGGRVKLADGWWRAMPETAGVTLPAGERVEIVGVEGTCVKVRPISA